jgi:hypothetical protein
MKPSIAHRQKLSHFTAAAFVVVFAGAFAAHAATSVYFCKFRGIGENVSDPQPSSWHPLLFPEYGSLSTIVFPTGSVTRMVYHTTALITGRYFQAIPVLRRQSRVDVVNGGSGAGSNDFAALQMRGPAQSSLSPSPTKSSSPTPLLNLNSCEFALFCTR